ncbi:unnamed protein product [Polarella glacialis]|uniref:Uncharacterized protein n=2 Tax=Polarella glacialis TaxID=89957 RepID=A0A813J4A9_POLGL|nr:unnamed protein product [Polarella glacialis]
MSACVLDWNGDPLLEVPVLAQSSLLILGANLIRPGRPALELLASLHGLCLRRGALATRILLANWDQQPDNMNEFLEQADQLGFSARVVARHFGGSQAGIAVNNYNNNNNNNNNNSNIAGIAVHELGWHLPIVQATTCKDMVKLSAELPEGWVQDASTLEILWASREVRLNWPRWGWRALVRLPTAVDEHGTGRCVLSKRTRRLHISMPSAG